MCFRENTIHECGHEGWHIPQGGMCVRRELIPGFTMCFSAPQGVAYLPGACTVCKAAERQKEGMVDSSVFFPLLPSFAPASAPSSSSSSGCFFSAASHRDDDDDDDASSPSKAPSARSAASEARAAARARSEALGRQLLLEFAAISVPAPAAPVVRVFSVDSPRPARAVTPFLDLYR